MWDFRLPLVYVRKVRFPMASRFVAEGSGRDHRRLPTDQHRVQVMVVVTDILVVAMRDIAPGNYASCLTPIA